MLMRMSGRSWWLDELAHAGAEHLDADFVQRYDRKQGTVLDEAAAADLEVFRAHGLRDDATVVDLGAGTGVFALAAAAQVRHVVAVEVSPAMCDVLRARTANQDNIEVVQAGLLSYKHRGAPVDAIHTRNVLHQLPDFWKAVALDRMAQMLAPGGIMRLRDLVYDFAPAAAQDTIEQWLAGAASHPADGYTRQDLSRHIRSEHSTFSWLLVPMLRQAGFEILDVSGTQFYRAYTCLRPG
jgi:ubiquinone/menaquinone biosynthesis C-methylase UbiE